MNLRQLNYFVAVGEVESVSKASAQLRIAQPALTRHLKHLEGQLGAPLTRRLGRGIVLTDAGRYLLGRVRPLLDELARVEAEVMSLARQTPLEVSLGIPSALSFLADRFIERAATLQPSVRLRVVDGWSGFVLDWLQSGQLDLGIVYDGSGDARAVDLSLLASEDHHLIVPSAHPLARRQDIALSEIAALPLILPSRRHGLRKAVERALASIGRVTEPVAEVDALPTIRKLVERGIGLSIMSESEVRFHLPDTLAAIPIARPALIRDLFIARRVDGPRAELERVCDVLRQEASHMVSDGILLPGTAHQESRPKRRPRAPIAARHRSR